MKPVIIAFAALSVSFTSLIFYYNLKIVSEFRRDEELTATKLVIKEQIPDAFMALSISSLFFSLGAFLGASVLLFEIPKFQYFSELGVLTMLVGLLTFMKRISDAVTEGDRNELEEDSKPEHEDPEEKEDKEDLEGQDSH